MDTSLFSRLQANQAAAAHAVGTSLAPNNAAKSNARGNLGAASAATAKTATAKAATGSTTSSSANSATLTSSDFLTLLVTELQNQDPTTPTDPTQYISQLVGVNSLEQLISINTGISTLDSSVSTTSTSTGTSTGTGDAVSEAGKAGAQAVPAIGAAPTQQTRPAAGTGLS